MSSCRFSNNEAATATLYGFESMRRGAIHCKDAIPLPTDEFSQCYQFHSNFIDRVIVSRASVRSRMLCHGTLFHSVESKSRNHDRFRRPIRNKSSVPTNLDGW
mmetsp:Transcript_548/g.1194  ORF Transcript_548/g.1194 Transcript_548/m.1194 type:complete len:103 (+) Transcript_548:365-673(+)